MTIVKLNKLESEVSPDPSKHLRKLNSLKRELLRSYRTYLSFAIFENWHRTVGDKKSSNYAKTNVMQKLTNIKALYMKLCADKDNDEWVDAEETLAAQGKKNGLDSVAPDELYQMELTKLRERKAARKELEKKIKEQNEEEYKQMGENIQRNANKEII